MLVTLVGWAFGLLLGGGPFGLVVALLVAGAMAFAGYWKSDAVALRVSRARPADPREHARLHNLVEGLCIASGLPKPRLYVIDDPAPNAFATGRNPRHAAVAVTTGLLEKMNRVELEGVLAHELAHVKNYDILVSTLAVTLVGSVVLLADMSRRALWWGGGRRGGGRQSGPAGAVLLVVGLLVMVLAPLAGRAMQAAVSRRRESLADVTAVSLTRYPPGLIAALEKLRDDPAVVRSTTPATAHLWLESPAAQLRRRQVGAERLERLFDTHPPLEERIAALREL